MRDTWQLQRAKAELSKLIATSIERGPQVVTRHDTSGTATRDSLPDLSLPPRFRVDAGRPGGTGALSRP